MASAPKRRFSVLIDAGGDTREELISLLRHCVDEIENGSTELVSGGCGAGGYFTVVEDAAMTPELYTERLKKYLEEKRLERSRPMEVSDGSESTAGEAER